MDYLPFASPTIDEETIAGVADVLRSGWITTGPKVQEFERALSEYLGGRIVRTFTSATGALEVALQACGIGPGDEVIVPAMTFAASANVVVRVGARPVFVDVELNTRNLDPALLETAITPRTRAIMPVHFAGLAVDMERVYEIATRHKLRVIEDAAHAIGNALERPPDRQLRRPGLVQLPSQQEHDHDRGRSAESALRCRIEGSRAAALPRPGARRRTATPTSCCRAASTT